MLWEFYLEILARCLIFKDALNISFAVQNPDNLENLFVRDVINSDHFKSNNRPRAQILQLRVTGKIAGSHKRILAQSLNSPMHCIPKANSDFRNVYNGEVLPKLSDKVITGSLSVRNLHGRRPVLCSASMASVCRLTEPQNSSSPSCSDASPSASNVSNSSCVPVKPGTVRCSTAVKAASTTSSSDP